MKLYLATMAVLWPTEGVVAEMQKIHFSLKKVYFIFSIIFCLRFSKNDRPSIFFPLTWIESLDAGCSRRHG